MKLSKIALIASLASFALVPAVATAADSGTITFTGKVIGQTCNVNGGTNNFTITLPVVNKADLQAANSTAGNTAFQLALTGCPTTPTVTVGAKFYASVSNVDTNQDLKNTAATNPASNVAVQLLDASNTAINVATTAAAATNTNSGTALSGGAATLNYSAQYVSVAGTAGQGNVQAQVTYQITYQ